MNHEAPNVDMALLKLILDLDLLPLTKTEKNLLFVAFLLNLSPLNHVEKNIASTMFSKDFKISWFGLFLDSLVLDNCRIPYLKKQWSHFIPVKFISLLNNGEVDHCSP